MLKKINRLSAGHRLKNSTFLKTPYFNLRLSENNLENNRFGFVVKKTLDKKAVVRNRVKRVFRSCIEEMLSEINNGYDMLFFLEKSIIDRKREAVYQDIQNLLSEKKLLK